MFKKMRERKGFTLAELLIVVAIIGVLVAIAIPIFSSQLEKSRDAVTASNVRAAYAEAAVAKLTEEDNGRADYDPTAGTVTVSDIEVKGETLTDSGAAFKENGSFDLPFTVANELATALDKANDDGKIDVVFSWSGDVCSAALSS